MRTSSGHRWGDRAFHAFPRLIVLALLVPLPSVMPCRPAVAQNAERIRAILDGMPTPEEVVEIAQRRVRERAAAGGAEAPVGERPVPQVILRNGDAVRGDLVAGALPVETPYGRLQVPVGDIVEIRFALRVTPAAATAIGDAVVRLGDEDFEVRERASAELAEAGIDAIPALRRAMQASDEEVRKRAEAILEDLESLVVEDDAETQPLVQDRDRISTGSLTFDGVVAIDELAVRTSHGDLAIPRRDLATLRVRKVGARHAELAVPATATIPAGWLSSRLQVRRGQRILIQATGQMGVPDYGEFCGPGGLQRVSRGFAGLHELALVGKVGAKGVPFLIGSRFRGKAPASGTLHVGVVPFRYTHYTTAGSYEVKIRVR